MDLVKKKTVNFDLDTYERLSKLAAQLRMDNPGGGFVSMSAAVAVLLDGFEKNNVANLEEKEAAYNFLCNIQAFNKTLLEAGHLHGKAFVIIPRYAERRFEIFIPSYIVDSSPDRWELVGSFALPENEFTNG